MKWLVFLLASAFVVMAMISGLALAGDSGSSIKWYSFDEGMALAKSENKLAVLDYGADWCGACKEQDETTFSDSDVVALQDRCVFIKVDADREQKAVDAYFGEDVKLFGFTITKRPKLLSLPKVIITDSKGDVILRTDFISAGDLVRTVKAAKPQA
jgi:thiol:disulfide interchange protein